MRAYKTVNDSYIEPISFTVPRRAETFQADIFPPAVGQKPAASSKEWFDGKTAMPSKIDFESIYEGNEPKEIPSDYKPPAQPAPPPAAKPTPKAEEPREEPRPSAAAIRGPPPTMNEQKGSIAAMASKHQDNQEEDDDNDNDDDDDDETSSFEEIGRPAPRGSAPSRSAEAAKQPPPAKNQTAAAAPTPASTATKAPPIARSPVSSPKSTTLKSATGGGGGASGIETSLDQIKQLLENQTRIISAQNDKIERLASEVESVKRKVGTAGSSQDQSERIRQLELELEEARS